MKMIILTQCCCGCSLRTGTLVIAVLFAISSLCEFVVEVFQVENPPDIRHPYVPQWLALTEALANILAVVINLILIFATLTDRFRIILVWLCFYVTYAILILVAMINSFVVLPIEVSGALVLAYLLGFGVTVYSILVVNSHYRNLRDGVSIGPRPPIVLIV